MNKLKLEDFSKIIEKINGTEKLNLHYLYNVYNISFDTMEQLFEIQQVTNRTIDSYEIISYIWTVR